MGTDFPSPERLAAVTITSAALALAGWLRVPPRRTALRGRAVTAAGVVLEGVWKSYPRYEPGERTLRGFVARRLPALGGQERRWALRDVSLSAEPGEAVGRHRRQRRRQVDAAAAGLGPRAGRRAGASTCLTARRRY